MPNSSRIQRVSRIMQGICTFLIWVLPVYVIGVWFIFDEALLQHITKLGHVEPHLTIFSITTFSITTRILGCLVSMVPMAISIFGLFHLGHLFRLFGQGEIFGSENVHELLIVTRSLFAYGIATPIIGAVLSVIVTMNNPPGEKQLAFGIGTDDLTIFFIATVSLIIGWVMAEGHKISEENAQIV